MSLVIWSIEPQVVLPFSKGIVIQCLVVQCNVPTCLCLSWPIQKTSPRISCLFFLRCLWFRVLHIQYVIPLVNGFFVFVYVLFLFVCFCFCFALRWTWMERFPSTILFLMVYQWPLVKTWSCILGTFLGLFFYTWFCLQTMLGWSFITEFEINTAIPPTFILHSLDYL